MFSRSILSYKLITTKFASSTASWTSQRPSRRDQGWIIHIVQTCSWLLQWTGIRIFHGLWNDIILIHITDTTLTNKVSITEFIFPKQPGFPLLFMAHLRKLSNRDKSQILGVELAATRLEGIHIPYHVPSMGRKGIFVCMNLWLVFMVNLVNSRLQSTSWKNLFLVQSLFKS